MKYNYKNNDNDNNSINSTHSIDCQHKQKKKKKRAKWIYLWESITYDPSNCQQKRNVNAQKKVKEEEEEESIFTQVGYWSKKKKEEKLTPLIFCLEQTHRSNERAASFVTSKDTISIDR